jgi:predicted MFS family arabinose efflux permease
MAVNFIGPLLLLCGIISFVGIIVGVFKKNKNILKTSLIVFVVVALIFLLEGFLME